MLKLPIILGWLTYSGSKKGQNEEKKKKNVFYNLKKLFFLQFFFGCSFGFAFQR
jgi:hypothetical protein